MKIGVWGNLKQRLSTLIERATGPGAFNNYVITLFAVGSIWVTLFVDIGALRRPFWPELTAGLLATFNAVIWLYASRIYFANHSAGPGPSAGILLSFLGTGLVRNASLTLFSMPFGLTAPSGRLISSIVSAFALLVFASLTTSRRLQSQAIQANLLVERQKLLWLSATYDEKVLQSQRDLNRELESDLYPHIREISDKLQGSRDDNAKTAEYLIGTVGDVVRPLWTRLSDATDTILEQLDTIAAEVPTASRVQNVFDLRAAIRPTLTVGILLVISLTVAPALQLRANSIEFVEASLFVWLLLSLVRLVWPRRIKKLSLASATAILGLLYSVSFSGGLAIVSGLHGDFASQLVQLTFSIGGALVLSRLELAEQARGTVERQLHEQNRLLQELISGLRKQIWVHRRKAAWVLHGPVQSALVSSAMSLTQGAPSTDERRQLLANIEHAVGSLTHNGPETLGLIETLSEIRSVWARSCQITWAIDQRLIEQLNGDPETVACLVEIAREGVSNAIRHGGAKSVQIDVTAPSAATFEICVTDDGSGLKQDQPGLGSAMLDQISLSWSRVAISPGTRLCARVVRTR